VSNHSRFFDTQRFCQRMSSNCRGLHIQAIQWDRGVSDSPQVQSDQREFVGEQRKKRIPYARGFRIAVKEKPGRAVRVVW